MRTEKRESLGNRMNGEKNILIEESIDGIEYPFSDVL